MKVMLNGYDVEFETCVEFMDDEIREELHAEDFESEQEFIDEYCAKHIQKYGDHFDIV